MKSITILQPFATLIVLGAKRCETRTWKPRHRGELAIQAGTRFPDANRELCRQEPIRSLLKQAGYASWSDLPTGVVLGTVRLTTCVQVETLGDLDPCERALGDYQAGRWAWVLTEPLVWPVPLPWKGLPGIYEIPAAFLSQFQLPTF